MPVYLNGQRVNFLPMESLSSGDIVLVTDTMIGRRKYRDRLLKLGKPIKTYLGPYEGFYTVEWRLPRPPKRPVLPPTQAAKSKRKWTRRDPQVTALKRRRAERRAWHRANAQPANPFS